MEGHEGAPLLRVGIAPRPEHSLLALLALLPTWGANVQDADPPRFTPQSALAYGRFLGRRYRERRNLVWVLGPDSAGHDSPPPGQVPG